MLRFEKRVVVDAPVEDVFAYIVDPAHLPQFWMGAENVKDLERLPNGGYRFTHSSKLLGMHNEAKTETTEFVPNTRIMVKTHSALMDATISVWFEQLDSRKTLVRSLSDWQIHAIPRMALLATYIDHAGDVTLEAAKAHIEASIPVGAAR